MKSEAFFTKLLGKSGKYKYWTCVNCRERNLISRDSCIKCNQTPFYLCPLCHSKIPNKYHCEKCKIDICFLKDSPIDGTSIDSISSVHFYDSVLFTERNHYDVHGQKSLETDDEPLVVQLVKAGWNCPTTEKFHNRFYRHTSHNDLMIN